MRKRKIKSDIPPVSVTTSRRVRFEEVDPMACMWHGRYLSWFEDGREFFGKTYDLTYKHFNNVGVIVPIRNFTIEYCQPLIYDNTYDIKTSLIWNDSCLLEFHYQILSGTQIMTKAESIQMLLNKSGDILFDTPEFFKEFCEKWKNGLLCATSK